MNSKLKRNYRKISRDFKGQVELANRTPIEILEKMLVELHDYYIQNYLKTERELHPEKTTKEIIINMYNLRDKLKGRRNERYSA